MTSLRATASVVPLLLQMVLPLSAHNGAVSVATPVDGLVLDGDFDDWPASTVWIELEEPLERSPWPTDGKDFWAHFAVGYEAQDDALWVAAEAFDSSVVLEGAGRWRERGDFMEVFLDLSHLGGRDRPESYYVRTEPIVRSAGVPARNAVALRRQTTSSYRYEWRFDISDVGSTAALAVIGFAVLITDVDEDGSNSIHAWGTRSWQGINAAEHLGNIVLTPATGVLQGRLQWRGEPRPADYDVAIRSTTRVEVAMRTRTDTAGAFLVAVPPGEYFVHPEVGQGSTDSVGASVSIGDTTRLQFVVSASDGTVVPARPGRRKRAGPGSRRGPWTSFGVADGFPAKAAASFVHSEDGALWIGHGAYGPGGLTRYDGVSTQQLTVSDGLASDRVTVVIEDQDGLLWLGSDRGVSKYDGEIFTHYTRRDGLGADAVYAIHESQDGRLWVGTSHGLRYREGNRWQAVALPDELAGPVVAVEANPSGGLWVATESAVGHYLSGAWSMAPAVASPLVALAVHPDGTVYVGTSGDGAFSLAAGIWQHLFPDANGPHLPREVNAIHVDHAGAVWFTTWGAGVRRWDGTRLTAFEVDDGLANTQVFGVDEDRDGRLWFGTIGGSVSRYDGDVLVSYDSRDGLAGDLVFSVLEDSRGRLWCGTVSGLSCYDGETWHTYQEAAGLRLRPVYDILEDDRGWLWFKAPFGLALYREGGWQVFTMEDGLPPGFLGLSGNLLQDHQGRIWLGSYDGLAVFDGDRWSEVTDRLGGRTRVSAIHEDKQGRLWFGGAKLHVLEDRSWTQIPGELPGDIVAIAERGLGGLWLGQDEGNGLGYFDGDTIQVLAPDEPLFSGLPHSMATDDNGHLWIGDWGEGIRRTDGRVVQALGMPDGLPDQLVQDISRGPDGTMWIATERGVMGYRATAGPPTVRIVGVAADREYAATEAIELTTDQDRLQIEFQGASLGTRPEAMIYLYRLDGHEEDWHQGRDGEVSYKDLPIGVYTFVVQAVDRDLNYSEPASIAVSVVPNYSHYALIGGLGLSLICMVIAGRYGLRRRRERDVARTELVRERRSRIEAQPHEIEHWTLDDFVGSSAGMEATLLRIRDLQQEHSCALITGEAGTGKELVARAIHSGSQRAGGPFVVVRCATLPRHVESLDLRTEVLSILFGHAKGAFPGAEEDRPGLVQEAQGGTLLLDEVGVLPVPLQTHLSRVLMQREVRRAGTTESERLDLRVLASTSEDLEMQVQLGEFSLEFYEYLSVQAVMVPPLRDRPEDIAPLAQQIFDSVSRDLGLEPEPVSEEVVDLLRSHGLPGNVRQLRRILEQAVRLSGGPIKPEDLGLPA